MDGDSKPYFRRYCHDLPQDTELPDRYLPYHHWGNGYHSIPQIRMDLVISVLLVPCIMQSATIRKAYIIGKQAHCAG
jgi:hypothetical protein